MERPQRGNSVLGWNDPRGVLQSWDGTTPGGYFSPGMERPQGGKFSSKMERPLESIHPRMERPQGGPSVLGWNDPREVLQAYDGTTPGGSFSHRMGRPQGGHSVLGWNDSMGVIQF